MSRNTKELLFENRSVRSGGQIWEVMFAMVLLHPLYLGISGFALVEMLVGVLLWVFADEKLYLVFVIGILLLSYPLFKYFSDVYLLKEKDEEMSASKGKVNVVTSAYPWGIMIETSNGTTSRIGYDKLRKMKRTLHYLILVTDTSLMCVLDKRCFTVGTKRDFVSLIKEKIKDNKEREKKK